MALLSSWKMCILLEICADVCKGDMTSEICFLDLLYLFYCYHLMQIMIAIGCLGSTACSLWKLGCEIPLGLKIPIILP